jgi:hypothetical protein
MPPKLNDQSQVMQIRLALPSQSAMQQPAKPLNETINEGALKSGLTQVQLRHLADHDIVLLVDKSSSMSTMDCPVLMTGTSKLRALSSLVLGLGGMSASRWDWCLRQTAHMAKQTEDAIKSGFTVILFAGHFDVFPHVTAQQLPKIFSENSPGGNTNLAEPLKTTFDDYFRRKRMSNGNVKPLLIGVITDGCPDNANAVRHAIISATRAAHSPSEITVIFFLIGEHDRRGEEFAFDLSNNLMNEGAPFQIVKAVPFRELEELGLALALANQLQ